MSEVEAYGMRLAWPLMLLVLTGGALLRSHTIYWLGRAVAAGTARQERALVAADAAGTAHGPAWWRAVVLRTAAWTRTPAVQRAVRVVRRWGAPVVTLAYLTVGVQSVVFVSAGVVRMPYPRFALASLPGSVAWAAVWSTIGVGAWWGLVALAAGSPWGLAAIAAVALTVVALVVRSRQAARRAEELTSADPR